MVYRIFILNAWFTGVANTGDGVVTRQLFEEKEPVITYVLKGNVFCEAWWMHLNCSNILPKITEMKWFVGT